jgi:PAS domain S-box-containing protein
MAEKPSYKELEKRIQELEQSESLHEAQQYARSLIEANLDALITISTEGKITDVNTASELITGISRKEIIGTDFSIYFTDPDAARKGYQQVFQDGTVRDYPLEIRHIDGRVIPVFYNASVYKDSKGNLAGVFAAARDITEIKKAEEALNASYQYTRGLIEANLDALVTISPEGKISDVNKASELITGLSRKEIIGTDFSNYFTNPDAARNGYQQVFRDGTVRGYPLEIKHLDGKVIPVLYNASVYKDAQGNVAGVFAAARDITERKQAEEVMLSRDYLEKLTNSMWDAVFSVKMPERVIEWGNNSFRLLGYEPSEYLGKRSSFLYADPDAFLSFGNNLKEAIAVGKDVLRTEELLKRKNGEVFSAEITSTFHRENNEIVSVTSMIRDLTEKKQAEIELRASENKYRSMMKSMNDQVYICSPELRLEYTNPAMNDRIGLDKIGEHCYKAIYNRDKKCPSCVFDQVQKGKHVEFEEYDLKGNRYYSTINSPIFNVDGTVSKLTIFRDITEIKNINEQLQQSRKMESIGTLAGGIAHDFNNLLYMISGNAELALEDTPKWNPVHTNLEEIKSASLRGAGIVKQLLNFSRKTENGLKPIGAVTVIKDALNFLRASIPATIDIRKHLPDADITIFADPVQINQILMNLCINASQAMEDTGGILEVNIEITTLEAGEIKNFIDLAPGKYLKMTVSDTGPGIAEEIINRIFDPYFTTKEMGKGSGMGLSIVHGIVQNHNGAISVDTKPGKGTTFSLLFPVLDEKIKIKTETIDEIPRGHETILFVDDEKSITDMTQKMLRHLGYKVETSLNPLHALDLFQSKSDTFDLVITDMTMPQMTGAKLAKKLMEIRSDIPVIICTGHSSLIDEEKAIQFGIAGYVMKPVSMSTIAKAIRKVLNK